MACSCSFLPGISGILAVLAASFITIFAFKKKSFTRVSQMFCQGWGAVAGPFSKKGEYPPGGTIYKSLRGLIAKIFKIKNYFYLFNNDSHFICRSQALPHPLPLPLCTLKMCQPFRHDTKNILSNCAGASRQIIYASSTGML